MFTEKIVRSDFQKNCFCGLLQKAIVVEVQELLESRVQEFLENQVWIFEQKFKTQKTFRPWKVFEILEWVFLGPRSDPTRSRLSRSCWAAFCLCIAFLAVTEKAKQLPGTSKTASHPTHLYFEPICSLRRLNVYIPTSTSLGFIAYYYIAIETSL